MLGEEGSPLVRPRVQRWGCGLVWEVSGRARMMGERRRVRSRMG